MNVYFNTDKNVVVKVNATDSFISNLKANIMSKRPFVAKSCTEQKKGLILSACHNKIKAKIQNLEQSLLEYCVQIPSLVFSTKPGLPDNLCN